MSQTMSVADAIRAIEDDAKISFNAEIRDWRGIQIGRQGDVYIHKVADDHPRGKVTAERQVAIGTTLGSRHVVADGPTLYEPITAPNYMQGWRLLGQVVEATEDWWLTHPEHPNAVFGPGVYQITWQLDARTMRQVAD